MTTEPLPEDRQKYVELTKLFKIGDKIKYFNTDMIVSKVFYVPLCLVCRYKKNNGEISDIEFTYEEAIKISTPIYQR